MLHHNQCLHGELEIYKFYFIRCLALVSTPETGNSPVMTEKLLRRKAS